MLSRYSGIFLEDKALNKWALIYLVLKLEGPTKVDLLKLLLMQEVEAQKREWTCPSSQSNLAAELGL